MHFKVQVWDGEDLVIDKITIGEDGGGVGGLGIMFKIGAINYEHPHIKDYYGTLLSDDVKPAREIVADFNQYVDCEAGDYLEVIVFNKYL